MSKNNQLGKLITEQGARDAIHIAIAPAIAGVDLLPGEHVGVAELPESGNYIASVGLKPHVGIVDPYLKEVKEGQKFYIMLYPNTIADLKHTWSHPEFDPEMKQAMKELTELLNKAGITPRYFLNDVAVRWADGYPTVDEDGERVDYDQCGLEHEQFWETVWTLYTKATGKEIADKVSPYTCCY